MSSNISIATWKLGVTTQEAAESILDTSPIVGKNRVEGAFDDDARKKVEPNDIKPGGKYYFIVKLQIKYEGQEKDDPRHAMGTGWLIANDLLVTAGHCAYDHQYGFGRAIEVKAYVGYYGKDSVKTDTNVQFRRGIAIATTKNWINSEANRANDVSFIRVEKPFDNVIPIKWESTPIVGNFDLGVVGYPADKESTAKEKGAEMYEMFAQTRVDLKATPSNMLEYTISTYPGQSGSPVLVRDANKVVTKSIGAHVYGLSARNSASVIRGAYGNDFGAYISTFGSQTYPTVATVENVTYLNVPKVSQESGFTEEGFMDVFRKVVGVGAKITPIILQAGTPFLGPQGTKIAAAVGTAVAAANDLVKVTATESEFGSQKNYKGRVARAVLAEATLQYVVNKEPTPNKLKIFEAMRDSFEKNQDSVKLVAKTFGPPLLEPALRIAIGDSAARTGAEASIMNQYPRVGDVQNPTRAIDAQSTAFVQKLSAATSAEDKAEGFLDFLNPFATLGTAVNVIGSGIGAIVKSIGGSESSLTQAPTPADSLQEHMETLCHRALMAEAALQAAMKIPVSQHEEGFFGDLVSVVKDIGGPLIKAAPILINTVAPLVKSLTESSMVNGDAGPNVKPLASKASIGELARSGAAINTKDGASGTIGGKQPSTIGGQSLTDAVRSGNAPKEAAKMATQTGPDLSAFSTGSASRRLGGFAQAEPAWST